LAFACSTWLLSASTFARRVAGLSGFAAYAFETGMPTRPAAMAATSSVVILFIECDDIVFPGTGARSPSAAYLIAYPNGLTADPPVAEARASP
jgi:hypothetical protein